MDLEKQIAQRFAQSIAVKQAFLAGHTDQLVRAGALMVDALTLGKKIMACGNGGSAGDAQHFCAELLNRYTVDRRSLPAIALAMDSSTMTSIANDASYDEVFSKPVLALAQPGDVLLAITTSGTSANIIQAVSAAKQRGCRVVALLGQYDAAIAAVCDTMDVLVTVPSQVTGRIQEVHICIIHSLCEWIEQSLFEGGRGDEAT